MEECYSGAKFGVCWSFSFFLRFTGFFLYCQISWKHNSLVSLYCRVLFTQGVMALQKWFMKEQSLWVCCSFSSYSTSDYIKVTAFEVAVVSRWQFSLMLWGVQVGVWEEPWKRHPGHLQQGGMSGAVETGKRIEIIPPGVSQCRQGRALSIALIAVSA